jgi:hypothetical protein
MSIIGNVNGWPLIGMPATPGPRQVDWKRRNIVGAVPNPFTGKQQIQSWQAGWWEATVTMPPMSVKTAGAWESFLDQVQGQTAVFYFGDALRATPQGSAEGTGLINGIFQGPYSLTTSGWAPNQTSLLLPGDWLQVGWRIYRCQDIAASDGAGNSSFAIWPQVREQPASGTPIITTNPQGLFRMATNDLNSSESDLRTIGLSFPIREAI